ncbi:MAG: hypothetical protein P1P84_02685 [Deferrisomatales bacterium]|nr:hypothetical protein [Deferrisomatales bacterium]
MALFQNAHIGTVTITGDRVSAVGPKALIRDASGNMLMAAGTTVPADAGSGYAVGCTFVKTNGGGGSPANFTNQGSATSCKFRVSAPVPGWNIGQAFRAVACSNGQTALPVITHYENAGVTTDPLFYQFSLSDDGDYVIQAVPTANTITPELSADPLTAHAVQCAVLDQDIMPGWVCTHAGTQVSVADAAGAATNTITTTGSTVGDIAFASFSVSDDTDQVGGAAVGADATTVYLSTNPLAAHTISYAVFAPVAHAVPAYYIAYAGVHTTLGGAAAEAVTVTGALTTDILVAQLIDKGSTPRLLSDAIISAADTVTLTFADDPSTDHLVSYMILRAC